MRTEPQDQLRAKVDETLAISKKILESAEKTRRQLVIQSIGGWIRTILWLVPLALAAIFLPPYIAKINRVYQSLTNSPNGFRVNAENLKIIDDEVGSFLNSNQ